MPLFDDLLALGKLADAEDPLLKRLQQSGMSKSRAVALAKSRGWVRQQGKHLELTEKGKSPADKAQQSLAKKQALLGPALRFGVSLAGGAAARRGGMQLGRRGMAALTRRAPRVAAPLNRANAAIGRFSARAGQGTVNTLNRGLGRFSYNGRPLSLSPRVGGFINSAVRDLSDPRVLGLEIGGAVAAETALNRALAPSAVQQRLAQAPQNYALSRLRTLPHLNDQQLASAYGPTAAMVNPQYARLGGAPGSQTLMPPNPYLQ